MIWFISFLLLFSINGLEAATLHLKSGWNLVGSHTNSFDPNTKIVSAKSVWVYRDKSWSATSPDRTELRELRDANITRLYNISYGEGFWVNVPNDIDIEFENRVLSQEALSTIPLSEGWNLLSLKIARDINVSDYFFDDNNISIVWKYTNNKWSAYSANRAMAYALKDRNISKIDTIKSDEGFWVLSKANTEINTSRIIASMEENNTILVPLYSHPPSISWDKLFLFNHLTQRRVMVIINPSNGDFTRQSSSYKKLLEQLHKNNIFTIGYLYTSYAERNIADIKTNIDNYVRYYPTIDGYFFDEMNDDVSQLDYYKELITYGNKYSIVNPGTSIDREYIEGKFIDLVVDYEGNYGRIRTLNNSNEKTKLAVIYYNAPADARAPEGVYYQYIDDDDITENFSQYITPKSWQLYSTLANNAKLQYPESNTSYIFPDDLEQLPKSVQFFMDKKLMQMKSCSANSQRDEFRFADEFNTTTTKNSLELNITLAANNDVTLMQIQSVPNYIPLLRISYKDNTLWGHVKETNSTIKVNLGDYHSGQIVKEEVDNGTLNIYIDNVKRYSKDISYWDYSSFFKFGLYPQTAGCDELNVTDIIYKVDE